MEVVEPVLQKKYHKIRSLSRGNSLNSMTDSLPPMTSASSRSSSVTQSKANDEPYSLQAISKGILNRADSTSAKNDAMPSTSSVGSNGPMGQRKNLPTLSQQASLVLNRSQHPAESNSSSYPFDLAQKRAPSTSSAVSVISVSSNSTTPLHIDTSAQQENLHPQNPERSIIKSLLLNSRGLAVPTAGEGDDAVYTCPLCKITFRSADNLQYHTKCYCQGTPSTSQQSGQQQQQRQHNESPHSAPISPVGSPSHKYFRSNSFNLCLPEKYSPNTLAKLASSSLRHPHRTPLSLAKLAAQQANPYLGIKTSSSMTQLSNQTSTGRLRPDNIVINTSTCPAPIPLGMSGPNAHPSSSLSVSSQCVQITKQLMDAALPSPGPLLGKTRLVDAYSSGLLSEFPKFDNHDMGLPLGLVGRPLSPSSLNSAFGGQKHDSITITPVNNHNADGSSLIKRPRLNNYPMTSLPLPLPFAPAPNPFAPSLKDPPKSRLQMCGGGIKIVPKNEDMQPRFGLSGGSIINISPTTESSAEPSPLNIRTGLNSGGSVIETPKKLLSPSTTPSTDHSSKSSMGSMGTPQSSASYMSANPNLRSSNMNFFQFPPINSITGYNPLTLPAVTGSLNTAEPTRIYHGGKFIPFVQGMPGPNTGVPQSQNMQSFRNEFPMPQSSMKAGRGRSPSPSRKKIIPSSPIPIRALPTPSPNSRYSGYSKSPFPSPAPSPIHTPSPKPRSLSRLSSPAPSEEELHRATPSAFTGLINSSFQGSNSFMSPWNQGTTMNKSLDSGSTSGKKSFNFSRIADNLSPLKPNQRQTTATAHEAQPETRHFNFEKLIPKPMVLTRAKLEPNNVSTTSPLHIDVSTTTTASTPRVSVSPSISIPTLVLPATNSSKSPIESGDDAQLKPPSTASTKFLRPSSLPLKPGTFTPKMHHGITPTANTLPLISPETPRPSKNCVQLYLNGHAYTYLGLKCSTKPFYCTVNRPQPSHFTSQPKLSIYGNWQVCAESNPHPLGLSPKEAMSLYDSRQRLQQYRRAGKYSVCQTTTSCTTLQSKMCITTPYDSRLGKSIGAECNAMKEQLHASTSFIPFDSMFEEDKKPKPEELLAALEDGPKIKIPRLSPKQEPNLSGGEDSSNPKLSDGSTSPTSSTASTVTSMPPAVPGGYESNEDYTYVRGRGRGRYVCSECGIRCKKPSMLKKHIRTHTDVRPYTCQHCSFR